MRISKRGLKVRLPAVVSDDGNPAPNLKKRIERIIFAVGVALTLFYVLNLKKRIERRN